MRYEIYVDSFNGRYEAPLRLVAPSDQDAIRLAARLPVGSSVLEIWETNRLVGRLQPEQMTMVSAAMPALAA